MLPGPLHIGIFGCGGRVRAAPGPRHSSGLALAVDPDAVTGTGRSGGGRWASRWEGPRLAETARAGPLATGQPQPRRGRSLRPGREAAAARSYHFSSRGVPSSSKASWTLGIGTGCSAGAFGGVRASIALRAIGDAQICGCGGSCVARSSSLLLARGLYSTCHSSAAVGSASASARRRRGRSSAARASAREASSVRPSA